MLEQLQILFDSKASGLVTEIGIKMANETGIMASFSVELARNIRSLIMIFEKQTAEAYDFNQ
jgi:hypothetical protein